MKRSTLLPVAAVSLGLLAIGVAVAAPSEYKAVDCKVCWEGGPIPCGGEKLASCTAMAEKRLEAYWQDNKAPLVPMLRANKSQLPRDLKQGKYKPYIKGASVSDSLTSVLWPSGTLATLPKDRVSHVDAAIAAKKHRRPEWDANGQKIKTCAEYGYENIYDVGRFLDAANACTGDQECILDIALMTTTPGLDKPMNRKDGAPMTHQLHTAQGPYPKNDMFQFGSQYLSANGVPGRPGYKAIAFDPELKQVLDDGETYYRINEGTTNDKIRSFKSEWDFHRELRKKVKSVTPAEHEEYDRRKAEFRNLTAQLQAAMQRENEIDDQVNDMAKQKPLVLPYDMRTSNPFERFDHVRTTRTALDSITKDLLKKYGPSHFEIQSAPPQQQGALPPRALPAAGLLGSLAPTPQTADSPTWDNHEAKPKKPPKASTDEKSSAAKGTNPYNPCNVEHAWGFERIGQGPISCKLGEFLRDEWRRKKAGFKSCLDLGNTDCDWEPEMLTATLAQVPSLDDHIQHENYCKAWSTGSFNPEAKNLVAAWRELRATRLAVGDAWRKLSPYLDEDKQPNPHGIFYEGGWGAQETYGDKDWFAAKLGYDIGWYVTPADSNAGGACELKGGLHADIDIRAWFQKPGAGYRLIDGNLQVGVNEDPDHPRTARYKGHLVIKNQQVFVTGGADDVAIPGTEPAPAWVIAEVAESEPIALQKTKKASFQYWIGGIVPVTGSLWGELMGTFVIASKGKSPTGCDAQSLAFRAEGTATPTFFATAYGSVGVGVVDLASAGVRGAIHLVQVELPLVFGLNVRLKDGVANLVFDASLDLVLRTLSGRISLYLQFLVYDEEWELFRWSGVGPATVHLMPKLSVDLPVAIGMRRQCQASENCL
jgi:hypothetical protein